VLQSWKVSCGMAYFTTKLENLSLSLWPWSQENIYLDLLHNITFLQLQKDEVQIFQHMAAPPHYTSTICDALNEKFPGQWKRTESLITMLIRYIHFHFKQYISVFSWWSLPRDKMTKQQINHTVHSSHRVLKFWCSNTNSKKYKS
jgi:hypothetical protein